MAFDLPPDASAAATPPAIVAPAERAAEQIHVDSNGYHYVVNGNRLLAADAIQKAIEGQPAPKEAIDSLTTAYRAAGYILTGISAQVSDKLVAVNVTHGRITELDAPPDLVPYFTGLMERDDLARSAVLRSTVVAEIYAARQGVRPVLGFAPAAAVGGTKMTVKEEPIPGAKPWNASLSFGNLGSRFSSRYQATAAGALRPGGGLELSASYTQGIPGLTSDSAGSQYQSAVLSGSVMTPWGLYSATYNGVTYRIGEAASPLNPDGTIYTGTLSGLQLVYADEISRLVLTEGLSYVDNKVVVFDREFDLTDQSYGYAALGLVYNRSVAVLGQIGSFSVGVTGLKGLSPRRGSFLPVDLGVPNPHFSILQASFNYNQNLAYGLQFSLAISGQYADATVPQNNQWVIGGFGNLTAWLPAVLVGDSGALGRATLQTPTFAWQGYGIGANAFFESGLVRRHYTPIVDPVTRTLADAGISISGNTPFGTAVSLAYAWPVASRNVDLDAVNRNSRANLYFTLSQTF